MIERTTSYRRVKKLAPDWPLIPSIEVYYLIDVSGDTDTGVWAFVPYQGGFQVHAMMGPHCRGKRAAFSAISAFKWVFENTDCVTIFAEISAKLRHVHIMARHVGMSFDKIDGGLRCFSMARTEFNERKAA